MTEQTHPKGYALADPKRYQGTKTLKAWRLALGRYNDYRGWTPPDGEDQTTPGYMVEYEDGGKPNMPNHAGYVSWSPADVFEAAYHEISDDWRKRVREEQTELDTRIAKLAAFLSRTTAAEVGEYQMDLMKLQLQYMQGYSAVLTKRLDERGHIGGAIADAAS